MSAPSATPSLRRTERVFLAGARRHSELLVVGGVWAVFTAFFNVLYLWGSDAQVPFAFLRRLFGANAKPFAYQFGLALFEAPWYALGKALDAVGLHSVSGKPMPEATIALGTAVYVLLAVLVVDRILRRLEIRRRGATLLLALFGTPVFFYGTFSPGQTHVVDTLVFAVAVLLVLALFRLPQSPRLAMLLGLVVGVGATVRYFTGFEVVGVFAFLLFRRRLRDAAALAVGTGVAFGLLLLLPLGLGVGLRSGGYSETLLRWTILGPLKMLVSDRRGLFVWCPVALLGAIGYIRLLRTRRRDRDGLLAAALMAFTYTIAYVSFPAWDGGWSFSQRYLTSMFALVAMGLGALVDWHPRPALAGASIAAAWTVFLAFNLEILPPPHNDYGNVSGGATDVARQVSKTHVTIGGWFWRVYTHSNLHR